MTVRGSINLHWMINAIKAIAISEHNVGGHVALLETSIPHPTVAIRRDFGSLWRCVDTSSSHLGMRGQFGSV